MEVRLPNVGRLVTDVRVLTSGIARVNEITDQTEALQYECPVI